MSRKTRILLGRLAVPVVIVVSWEIVAQTVDQPLIVSSVGAATETLVAGVRDGWMLDGIGSTLATTLWMFLIAGAAGLFLGVILGLNASVERAVRPIIMVGWSLPKIVFYPMFLFVFGLGVWSKIALAVSFAIFPMIAFTITGVLGVRRVLLKVGDAFRVSPVARFTKIIAPAALPFVIVGLRYTFSVGFVGVVLAEMFASAEGLGTQLLRAQGLEDTARMLAVVAIMVAIGVGINFILYFVERRLLRWYGISQAEVKL